MIKKALIAAAAFLALSAHAGYAQLAAPAGYASTAAGHTYAAAANDSVFGRVIHQPAGLTANVGGRATTMPAAYRLAANAPAFMARAVFFHPAVRTAVGVASVLAGAYVFWDDVNKQWAKRTDRILSDKEYSVAGHIPSSWKPTPTGACEFALAAQYQSYPNNVYKIANVSTTSCHIQRLQNGKVVDDMWFDIQGRPVPCPPGSTVTPAGCLVGGPLQPLRTPEEFEAALPKNPDAWPPSVPKELPPGTPLPVEQPFINPAPGENPSNNPLRIPTGNPVPVPNTNPQQWKQPYVDIVPAPTPEQPWRVDVKPGETTSTNPNPAENPNPDGQDKPTEEQDKSLCEKHPEISACEKVEVTDKPLPDQPKLYEPKYPDGITGVWNSKMQEIKATPLFSLAPSLLPTVSAGSCPSWKIDLSIDGWTNAGLQDVSPPCWVWDVAKLVIIASALLLARRLIFGG